MKGLTVSSRGITSYSTIRVEIGDVCCAISCQDTDLSSTLKKLYGNFLTHKPADITIEFAVVNGTSRDELEAALLGTRIAKDGAHFSATGLTLEGEFDASSSFLSLKVDKALFDTTLEFKLMNRILPMAYYTVCQSKYAGAPPALLVHSCGLIRNGQALLFTGPSGSGKTTIARLCGSEHGRVLNDEMVLISRGQTDSGALKVAGAPIIGGFSSGQQAEAPLRCVLMLRQSKKTGVHRLTRLEAYLRFMRQVISPVHFGKVDKAALWSLMADFSDQVTRTTPFYELEFTLDQDQLWAVIGEWEGTLKKEERANGKSAE